MNNSLKSLRNAESFDKGRANGEALLIGYFMAGDPDVANALMLAKESVVAGIDILEIGIPSSHPTYDGDIIRRSHARVQKKGEISPHVLSLAYWETLRGTVETPVWVMGYRHDLFETGLYDELASRRLIDGIVIPDCDGSTWDQIDAQVASYNVDVVRFVNTAMDDRELAETVRNAALIYAQLYQGKTGEPIVPPDGSADFYRRISKYAKGLTVAGFGVRSPEKVRMITQAGFAGVVVGTALVARVEFGAQDSLYRLISDMKVETLRDIKKVSPGSVATF